MNAPRRDCVAYQRCFTVKYTFIGSSCLSPFQLMVPFPCTALWSRCTFITWHLGASKSSLTGAQSLYALAGFSWYAHMSLVTESFLFDIKADANERHEALPIKAKPLDFLLFPHKDYGRHWNHLLKHFYDSYGFWSCSFHGFSTKNVILCIPFYPSSLLNLIF